MRLAIGMESFLCSMFLYARRRETTKKLTAFFDLLYSSLCISIIFVLHIALLAHTITQWHSVATTIHELAAVWTTWLCARRTISEVKYPTLEISESLQPPSLQAPVNWFVSLYINVAIIAGTSVPKHVKHYYCSSPVLYFFSYGCLAVPMYLKEIKRQDA